MSRSVSEPAARAGAGRRGPRLASRLLSLAAAGLLGACFTFGGGYGGGGYSGGGVGVSGGGGGGGYRQPAAVALGEFPLSVGQAEKICADVLGRYGFRGPASSGRGLVFLLTRDGYRASAAFPHDERVDYLFRESRLELSIYRSAGGTAVVATATTRVRFASSSGREFTDLDLSALDDDPDTQLLYSEIYSSVFAEIAHALGSQ